MCERAASPCRAARIAGGTRASSAAGNFGAPPKPPHRASNAAREPRERARRAIVVVSGLVRPATQRADPRDVLGDSVALRRDLVAPVAPGLARSPSSTWRNDGRPWRRLGREVRAGEERLAVRREERRSAASRPLPGHRLRPRPCRSPSRSGRSSRSTLIDTKCSFMSAADRLVLERLALHHVAPVAGRVADRQEDRLVLGPGPARTPPAPTGTSRPGCGRAGAGRGWSRPARRFVRASTWPSVVLARRRTTSRQGVAGGSGGAGCRWMQDGMDERDPRARRR